MSLVDRRRRELALKLAGLEREFGEWLEASEAGTALEKHHTQIRRVIAQLRGMIDALRPVVDAVTSTSDAYQVEIEVLDVHRMWDHFRSKLVYRSDPRFRPHLQAADEFAWACYQPAQQAGMAALPNPAAVKEPPLVFLSGDWSPYTASRGIEWAKLPTSERDKLSAEFDADAAGTLPVPVISIPWSQVEHLPDLVVVGHEVGHAVIRDFGLVNDLRAAARRAVGDEQRRQAWERWAVELFCDWWGVLACGPAFAFGLVDYTSRAVDPGTEMQPPRGNSSYPTEALRVAAVAAMVRRLEDGVPKAERPSGFQALASQLEEDWRDVCPKHAMAAFDDDVAAVVEAFASAQLAGFGGKPAAQVLPFGAPQLTAATAAADRVLAAPGPGVIPRQSVRTIVGGARLAWMRDPDLFVERDGTRRFRDAVLNEIAAGVRAGPVPPGETETADRAAGVALLARIAERRAAAAGGGP